MIVSDEGQAKVFLIYILFGMLCIMLADFFYVIRKHSGGSKVKINVLDAVYYTIIFLLILYAGVRFNFGALRYYQLFALVLGMAVHKLLFSKISRKVFEFLLAIFIRLAIVLIKIVWKAVAFVLRCFFSVTEFLERKIMRVCHKAKRYADKVKVKRRKKKKTVKKRLKMI